MKITIDPNSGFCFGVVYAIKVAERELDKQKRLYCLGDIVHNEMEVKRLKDKGLKIIDHEEFKKLHNCKVLIRAHGEPPDTYKNALQNNIDLIDASCPVVLKLQNNIRKGYEEMKKKKGQIVIYGKKGHPEVNGLVGQTMNEAIIINDEKDIDKIDYTKPISLYSQTTKSMDGFNKIKKNIQNRLNNANPDKNIYFAANNTICRSISNRAPQIRKFASKFDVIVFVSGKKSSNGNYLYNVCKSVNQNTYFVSFFNEIKSDWFKGFNNIGICGATSTPMWLMEQASEIIKKMKF